MQTDVRRWSLAGLMYLLSVGAVDAANGAWNVHSGGLWSDGANWLDGIVAEGAGASALFTNAPNSTVFRPVVWVDQPLALNGVFTWAGDGSEFTFAPCALPDGSGYYAIDMGANGFSIFSSRLISFKTALIGSGTVKMSSVGILIFRNRQPFTSLLELNDEDGNKG